MAADEFTRYVILLKKIPEVETTSDQIRSHIQYLRDLERSGRLVLCGPFTDWNGGMLIVKAENRGEAQEIAEADPFVRLRCRDYEVRTWQLSCEANNHLGLG